jgi:CheY-like chemotaxis protein
MTRPILLVEDDPDSRHMLAMTLELEGHQVLTASNGAQAITMAKRHHPRLIILDLMMPVMSGEEFRRAQMASDDISTIPVVVVSAHHQARQIARRMAALDCLEKPVDIEKLLFLCLDGTGQPI